MVARSLETVRRACKGVHTVLQSTESDGQAFDTIGITRSAMAETRNRSVCRGQEHIPTGGGLLFTLHTQYSSEAYAAFAREYQFEHVTRSPHYPQANGEAERAVQTIKGLLKKEGDPYLALLAYRATPLQNGLSPSELLMSRRLRTTVPMPREQLKTLREREERLKTRQKSNFDRYHGVRELRPVSRTEGQSRDRCTGSTGGRHVVVRGSNVRRNVPT